MRSTRLLISAVVLSCAGTSYAAEFGIQGVSDPNIPAGYVANELFWDGGGVLDWTSSGLLINLSAGSFYQDPWGADKTAHPAFFDIFPTLEFDTAVGIPGDGSVGIPGGAGDLGGGPLSLDAPQLSVSWFNTYTDNTGRVRTGMLTLSDDAVGTGSLWVKSQVQQFTIVNGVIPDFAVTVAGTSNPPDPGDHPGPFPDLPPPPTVDEIGVTLRPVNSPDVPAGFVANQIVWNGMGVADWDSAAMRVDLTSGSVFDHPLGSDIAPNPAIFALYPDLAYDTYVGISGDTTGSISGGARTGRGNAGILGGDGVFRLEEPYLSVAWYNDIASQETGEVGIGMLTLSQDANGKIAIYAHGQAWSADIVNGVVVPEPASLALCGLAAVTLMRRRV